MSNKQVDILGFDAVAECEQAIPVPMKGIDGEATGAVFLVIGKHADAVTGWQRKLFNSMQREAEMAKKRGREPEPKSLDELKETNIEGAMTRVIGWQNIKQEFSKELLKTVLTRNPHFVEQIVEASDDLGNFTKPN
ncbi:MAG TPA: hypothetical protein VFX01_08940 [Methylophilaceae bacterium]|nr:hypothetical protein [Methylophilaceae bacterium]